MSYTELKVLDGEGVDQEIEYSLKPIIIRIKHAVSKIKAKRVVIDSMACLFTRFKNHDKIRNILFKLSEELEKSGITMIFSSEAGSDGDHLTKYGVEEYTLDGFIQLKTEFSFNSVRRYLYVRKLRGVEYRNGKVEYVIDNNGITVFPKIPIDTTVFKTNFKKRLSFGLPAFDKLMGGGIPQGHTILIGGNTGSEKTTIGMHFLTEGVKKGENVLWLGLEESKVQVFKTAKEHGWNFDSFEKKGNLVI
ncbi:MAG: hypothetical protein GF349_04775 [Candidatus Magasanikbacteria bacterium]|nr:hypothetical protein [Candidatus Magasanikbacteria bacterium]